MPNRVYWPVRIGDTIWQVTDQGFAEWVNNFEQNLRVATAVFRELDSVKSLNPKFSSPDGLKYVALQACYHASIWESKGRPREPDVLMSSGYLSARAWLQLEDRYPGLKLHSAEPIGYDVLLAGLLEEYQNVSRVN